MQVPNSTTCVYLATLRTSVEDKLKQVFIFVKFLIVKKTRKLNAELKSENWK